MTAHSAIFTATRESHIAGRLSTLDCLSQIETLALDRDCDTETKIEALTYAAQVLEGHHDKPGNVQASIEALSTDELRAVLDDFETYFPAE